MTRERAGNWIEEVSPADRTIRVAALTLRNCLESVLRCLPLAAEKADEDPEHIHHLRVWTRRSAAALRLYKRLLPRRRSDWINKQLKRIRRAANDARDLDVLIQRLEKQSGKGTQHWLNTARAERRKAQRAVSAAFERLRRGDRFAQRINKFLERVGSRTENSDPGCFGHWAREQLRPVLERFFDAVPTGCRLNRARDHAAIVAVLGVQLARVRFGNSG